MLVWNTWCCYEIHDRVIYKIVLFIIRKDETASFTKKGDKAISMLQAVQRAKTRLALSPEAVVEYNRALHYWGVCTRFGVFFCRWWL
jgi:hypothetical protein